MPWSQVGSGSGGGSSSGGGSINVRGSVPTSGDLPATGNTNDAYITEDTGHLWVWTGTKYTDAGPVRGPAGPAGTKGAPGDPGSTPTFVDGFATTLGSGAQPTADVVEVGPNTYRVDFGIPAGAQGPPGQGITSGRGAPNASTPGSQTGALYVDTDTYDLYRLS